MKKKKNLIEIDPKMTQIWVLSDVDFKTTGIDMSKKMHQMKNFIRDLGSVRNNQLEIQELKNTITEIESSISGFTGDFAHLKRDLWTGR